MIVVDEDAVICDFAETYHVLDYRSLPLMTAAALAAGLRQDARIMDSIRADKRERERETEVFDSKESFNEWRNKILGEA